MTSSMPGLWQSTLACFTTAIDPTVPVRTLLVLLLAHWLGDFVLQTDEMARNKSKCWLVLGLHASVYTATLAILTVLYAWSVIGWLPIGAHYVFPALPAFLLANGLSHFAIDAVTSRINARLWQTGERHWFFVSIGWDQGLHVGLLVVTAAWWLQ